MPRSPVSPRAIRLLVSPSLTVRLRCLWMFPTTSPATSAKEIPFCIPLGPRLRSRGTIVKPGLSGDNPIWKPVLIVDTVPTEGDEGICEGCDMVRECSDGSPVGRRFGATRRPEYKDVSARFRLPSGRMELCVSPSSPLPGPRSIPRPTCLGGEPSVCKLDSERVSRSIGTGPMRTLDWTGDSPRCLSSSSSSGLEYIARSSPGSFTPSSAHGPTSTPPRLPG